MFKCFSGSPATQKNERNQQGTSDEHGIHRVLLRKVSDGVKEAVPLRHHLRTDTNRHIIEDKRTTLFVGMCIH